MNSFCHICFVFDALKTLNCALIILETSTHIPSIAKVEKLHLWLLSFGKYPCYPQTHKEFIKITCMKGLEMWWNMIWFCIPLLCENLSEKHSKEFIFNHISLKKHLKHSANVCLGPWASFSALGNVNKHPLSWLIYCMKFSLS